MTTVTLTSTGSASISYALCHDRRVHSVCALVSQQRLNANVLDVKQCTKHVRRLPKHRKTTHLVSMTSAPSPSIPVPGIAHSGLSTVALDAETANSIEYVRIHLVHSHSVAVVTQAHNARRTTSRLPTSMFSRPHLIAAVDMQISQTATTRAVVFELFSTNQEKLMR